MSIRIPALAVLCALTLVACSDQSPLTAPVSAVPKAALALDAGVACTGVSMPAIQCQALVALYNSTNGQAWTDAENWGTGNPCLWSGVECSEDDHGSVVALDLAGKGLSGPIPAELANLDQAERITLSNALTRFDPTRAGWPRDTP